MSVVTNNNNSIADNGATDIAPSLTKAAMLCSRSLGDALIQMVVANNLARAGHHVVFYSDIVAPLDKHVENYQIKPFPSYESALLELGDYDLVLFDACSSYAENLSDALGIWLKDNAVSYRAFGKRYRHKKLDFSSIGARLPEKKRDEVMAMFRFKLAPRDKPRGIEKLPIVKQLAYFLQAYVRMEAVTEKNGLRIPKISTDPARVIISPTGAFAEENWTPEKYLALARELKADGYHPSFSVSPFERNDWESLLKREFRLPWFNSIVEVAEYYQSAAYFIGGDSGYAHLASSLGVPVIQIANSWTRTPAWRVGWSDSRLIVPSLRHKLSRKAWQSSIDVGDVLLEFKKLVNA